MSEYLFEGKRYFQCREIAVLDQNGNPRTEFDSTEEIRVSVTYEWFAKRSNLGIVVALTDEAESPILRTENIDDADSYIRTMNLGVYKTTCVLPKNLFGERRLYMTIGLICQDVQHVDMRKVFALDIHFQGYNDNYSIHSKQAYLRPKLHWSNSILGEEANPRP